MSDSYRIRYSEEDGALEREGIVTPRGSRVVAHSGKHIIAKIPGHSYPSGTGQPWAYGAAEFVLYEEVYSDAERELYNDNPWGKGNDVWAQTGDVNGWINVHEELSWPVRS